MTTSSDQSAQDERSTERRIRLEHRLGIRRILVDRLLIGLLLALVGFIATLAVEQYKVTTSETRYFLEERLEAATYIRSKFTNVTKAVFEQTVVSCDESAEDRPSVDKLDHSIDQLIDQLNDASLLFSQEYLTDANRVVNVFNGAATDPPGISCRSRYFFNEVADYFTHRTTTEIHGEGEGWNGYVPLDMDKEKIDKIGVEEYFQQNLVAWSGGRDKSPN